jgi:hypothetical protein
VKENFGSLDLFEGSAEARNKSAGKVADEADGIGKQNFAPRGEAHRPVLGFSEAPRRDGLWAIDPLGPEDGILGRDDALLHRTLNPAY